MSTLGSRIREAREKKEFSQSQLAELIGVRGKSIISQWEGDISKPDVNRLTQIARALDTPVSYLLDCDAGLDDQGLEREESSILLRYRSLDGIGKKRIEDCLTDQAERCEVTFNRDDIGEFSADPDHLFLTAYDSLFDAMGKSIPLLESMRERANVSYKRIARYLWHVGFGGLISVSDVEMVCQGRQVPSLGLYLAILTFLYRESRRLEAEYR